MSRLITLGEMMHELIRAAADGRLPDWSCVSEARHAHIERVVALLHEWAVAARVDAAERIRWRAAGWLHDALRDADPAVLRPMIPQAARDLPDLLLHGPACAERLREAGVNDEELIAAVAWHTVGHPSLRRTGHMLYLADFLEPGRNFESAWRARLRARMPDAAPEIIRDVAAARIRHLLESSSQVRRETVDFWNSLVSNAPAA